MAKENIYVFLFPKVYPLYISITATMTSSRYEEAPNFSPPRYEIYLLRLEGDERMINFIPQKTIFFRYRRTRLSPRALQKYIRYLWKRESYISQIVKKKEKKKVYKNTTPRVKEASQLRETPLSSTEASHSVISFSSQLRYAAGRRKKKRDVDKEKPYSSEGKRKEEEEEKNRKINKTLPFERCATFSTLFSYFRHKYFTLLLGRACRRGRGCFPLSLSARKYVNFSISLICLCKMDFILSPRGYGASVDLR